MRKYNVILSILFVWIILANCSAIRSQKPSIDLENFHNKTPWTHTHFNQDKFQFIIVSDRTGGMRPGIFKSAVDKINILQPDFVMSIGDLIDGYTQDFLYLDRQWKEFEDIISALKVPFFYLPGNHDISNDWMTSQWNQRLGKSYYHFVYQNVLFLCLNTEDPPSSQISDEQVDYFIDVLKKTDDVDWTFVFMHKPLWQYGDQGGYEHIEEVLTDRPFTLFSGHYHQYLKSMKNNRAHYILGTTGGGSDLRGDHFGEFDHLMWVTMKSEGPEIVNLKLDGIVKDDIVNDETYPLVNQLRDGNWIDIDPIIHEKETFNSLSTHIVLRNETRIPMTVDGVLDPQENLIFRPAQIHQQVNAQSEVVIPLNFRSHQTLSLRELIQKSVTLTFHCQYDEEAYEQLAINKDISLTLDYIHQCPTSDHAIKVDSDLADWKNETIYDYKLPSYIKEDWDWHGEDDGWYRLGLIQKDDSLYIAIETFDDELILDKSDVNQLQDKLIFHFYPFETDDWSMIDFKKAWSLELSAGRLVNESIHKSNPSLPEGSRWACRAKPDGLMAEIVFPLKESWKAFRFNIGWMDHDQITNQKPSVLWWRPPWGINANYEKSGVFRLSQ